MASTKNAPVDDRAKKGSLLASKYYNLLYAWIKGQLTKIDD